MAEEILRGFEIVKRGLFGEHVVVMKYRATELAARQCAADVKWLKWRHPNAGYEMRALISVPREEKEQPLVLEADDLPHVIEDYKLDEAIAADMAFNKTTEEQLAEIRVADGAYDVVVPE